MCADINLLMYLSTKTLPVGTHKRRLVDRLIINYHMRVKHSCNNMQSVFKWEVIIVDNYWTLTNLTPLRRTSCTDDTEATFISFSDDWTLECFYYVYLLSTVYYLCCFPKCEHCCPLQNKSTHRSKQSNLSLISLVSNPHLKPLQGSAFSVD